MKKPDIVIKWDCNFSNKEYGENGCGYEFETKGSLIEWRMGDCETICPKCRNALYQSTGTGIVVRRDLSSEII